MRYAIVTACFAAVAAAQTPAITWLPVLPLYFPGPIATANGINNLANTLINSAQNLSTSVNTIVAAANISADISQNATIKVDLVSALIATNNQFWKTTTDAENLVCLIATSITQQNVAAQVSNLIIGIQTQAQIVAQLQKQLVLLIPQIQSQLSAFTDSEAAIITALIRSIATSAVASTVPVGLLVNGLVSIGFSTLTSVYASLDASIKALASTAANVSIGPVSIG